MGRKTFEGDFKKFFGRGLAILLPSILTLWILWQAFVFVFSNVAGPINAGTRAVIVWGVPKVIDDENLPEWFVVSPEELAKARASEVYRASVPDKAIKIDLRRKYLEEYWSNHWYLNLTGLLVAILLIYLAGVLLSNFLGKRLYSRLENLISRIPGFKQVYPHVKQVVDLVLGEKKMAFRDVVLVEYPSKGIWTVGFLTGTSIRQIDQSAGAAVSSVFIPTSPTPFTGFTINVVRDKIVRLDLSVEEALRYVITAGVLTPENPTGEGSGLVGASGGPAMIEAGAGAEARERVERAIEKDAG
ncbi:MAG: DUF502 domain-containing protein [Phycisphaerales bacterium JB059]